MKCHSLKTLPSLKGGPTATLSPSSGHSKALGFGYVKAELRDLGGTLQAGAGKKSQATKEIDKSTIVFLQQIFAYQARGKGWGCHNRKVSSPDLMVSESS